MNILGIETSCDETAAAVVRDGREVLSNVVYTQIPLHQPYGGVVPEIASRAHIEKIHQVVGDAMRGAGLRLCSSGGLGSDSGLRLCSSGGLGSDSGLRDGRSRRESDRTDGDEARRLDIDAVAVTYGPGLSPALIVGLNAAKGLAKALNVPLIAINHIEAHLHTPFLYDHEEGPRSEVKGQTADGEGPRSEVKGQTEDEKFHCSTSNLQPSTSNLQPSTCTPALGLAISGGNTMWVDMPEYGQYEVIGETLDDAAGEAFDKAAKLLGLGYPGGLKIDRISAAYAAEMRGQGARSRSTEDDKLHCLTSDLKPLTSLIPFPKGRPREGVTALAGLPAELCVSFSGLKTALLRYVQQHPEAQADGPDARDYGGYMISPARARVVASYQEAIVQAVADRTRTALRRKRYRAFILGGGVSLNSRIREVLTQVCAEAGVPFLRAKPKYTGDNGAMIAGLAYYRRNIVGDEAMSVDVSPSLVTGATN